MKYASAIGFLLAVSTLAAMAMASPHEMVGDGWAHTWAGAGMGQGYSLALRPGGELYVTGYTGAFGSGSADLLLLKYDTSGKLLWQRTWGGGKEDYGWGVALNQAGAVFVTGYTHSFGEGSRDVILLKYDADGSLLWQRAWGNSGWEQANGLVVNQEGEIYVTGNTQSFKGGENPLILLKYDFEGNLLWRKAWTLGDYAEGRALALDREGNLLVTGSVCRFGDSFDDVVLLKYDADGTLLWQRQWGGDQHDRGSDLIQDINGNIYVAGYTSSFGAGEMDVLLLKHDSQGNVLWARTWGGFTDDHGMALALDENGDLLVAGSSASFGEGMGSVALLKYDADGELLHQQAWVGTAYGGGSDLVLNGLGSAYIAGYAFSRDGSWQEVAGEESMPAGRASSPRGTESTPAGVESVPEGTETEPEGLLDEKGGNLDVLVMKVELIEPSVGNED